MSLRSWASDFVFPITTYSWLIDDRETEFLFFLEELCIAQIKAGNKPIFDPQEAQLQVGDIHLSLEIGLEVKRISKAYRYDQEHPPNDLAASFIDGRLWEQTEQRNLAFKFSGIIIEKEEGASLYTPILTKEIWGKTALRLERKYNQHIYYTNSMQQTFELCMALFLDSLDTKDHHNPVNKDKRPTSLIDQQRYFLSGLKGIGKKASLELLLLFKTPLNILKWICETTFLYTKNGKIKGTTSNVPGYGPTFFQDNQTLLWSESNEVNHR
jgi:ERCC4-type nuclease